MYVRIKLIYVNKHKGLNMKKCSKCQTHKELKQFNKNRATIDGLDNICKDCRKDMRKYERCILVRKEYEMKSKYDMAFSAYKQLYQEREGKCDICKRTQEKALVVDTYCNEFKGLLCHQCKIVVNQSRSIGWYAKKLRDYLKKGKPTFKMTVKQLLENDIDLSDEDNP